MVECRKEDVLPASIAMTAGCDQRHADVAIDCFLDVVYRLRSQVGEAVYVVVRHLESFFNVIVVLWIAKGLPE